MGWDSATPRHAGEAATIERMERAAAVLREYAGRVDEPTRWAEVYASQYTTMAAGRADSDFVALLPPPAAEALADALEFHAGFSESLSPGIRALYLRDLARVAEHVLNGAAYLPEPEAEAV